MQTLKPLFLYFFLFLSTLGFSQGLEENDFIVNQTTCFSFNFKLIQSDSTVVYHWAIDNTIIDSSNVDSLKHTFSTQDSFNVCLYVIDSTGIDTTCKTVLTDSTLPVISIAKSENAVFCFGKTISIIVDSPHTAGIWSDNSNLKSLNVNQSGTYSFFAYNSDTSCIIESNKITTTVTKTVFPELSILSDSLSVCHGTQLFVKNNDSYANYKWFNNANSQFISIDSSANYYCKVVDSNSCIGISDTIFLKVDALPAKTSICKVSFNDSTEKVGISWNPLIDKKIVSYNIYKYNENNQSLIFLDNVIQAEAGFYIDYSSSPKTHLHKYTILAVDTCKNESDSIDLYGNILLNVDHVDDSTILTWNNHLNNSIIEYTIFAGTDSTQLDSITTLDTNYISIWDTLPNYYKVRTKGTNDCIYSFSNWAHNGVVIDTTTEEENDFIGETDNASFKIYPNPTHHFITIENSLKEWHTVSIYNKEGMLMDQFISTHLKHKINIQNWSKGYYIIEISTSNKQFNHPIIIQ